MTPDEAIKIVKAKSRGRTRYTRQAPFLDEVLVAEIERLRKKFDETSKNGGGDGVQDRRGN